MSKHTPEPWAQSHRRAKNREGYYTEVYDSAGETIATLAWYPVEEPGGVISTSRSANAARIVACVNALEGVDDPPVALKDARQALRLALPYVQNCYECASVEIAIISALLKLGGAR